MLTSILFTKALFWLEKAHKHEFLNHIIQHVCVQVFLLFFSLCALNRGKKNQTTWQNLAKTWNKHYLFKKHREYSLYLFGIFVANENDDGVDVNAVKAFDGVRGDVK